LADPREESGPLRRIREVIRRGVEVNRPDPTKGLDVLSKVGGYEIGGIAGCILSGAKDLVEKQIRVLEEVLEKIQKRSHKGENRFMKLVYGFKAGKVACLISWLMQEALPFVERKEIGKKGTSPKRKEG
jgi:Phosphoribosyltransferase